MSSLTPYAGPAEPPTDPRGPTGKLCEWLVQLSLDQVPADVLVRAKALLLDGMGCALSGAQLPWSRIAVEAVCRFEGAGSRTIIGWDRTLAAPAAALLNGTFIQAFELDDVHFAAPLHSASLIIPSILACAEEIGNVSGAALLLAAIAGFEVGPRVGLSLRGQQMLSRGWHSGSVFGTHAAAASAGKLLGLDGSRFEDAFGLAGTQSAGLMAAQYEAMSKRMHHGFSARNGLYAAFLACQGYTGIKRVFEREYGGFLAVFGEGHDPLPEMIANELGESWETRRIAVKPYAAMAALHGPIDGIFDIMAKRPFGPADVAHIEVGLTHVAYHHSWWRLDRPTTPIGAQMNVGYGVAVAILDREAMVHQFSPKRIDQDDIWDLMPRIEAVHDTTLVGNNCRVTVTFKDGSSESVTRVSRTSSVPFSNDEITQKFRDLTDGILTPSRQQAIIEGILGLEDLKDVSDLSRLLAEPVASPF